MLTEGPEKPKREHERERPDRHIPIVALFFEFLRFSVSRACYAQILCRYFIIISHRSYSVQGKKTAAAPARIGFAETAAVGTGKLFAVVKTRPRNHMSLHEDRQSRAAAFEEDEGAGLRTRDVDRHALEDVRERNGVEDMPRRRTRRPREAPRRQSVAVREDRPDSRLKANKLARFITPPPDVRLPPCAARQKYDTI